MDNKEKLIMLCFVIGIIGMIAGGVIEQFELLIGAMFIGTILPVLIIIVYCVY